jgi:hypothetical protein
MNDNLPEINFKEKKEKKGGALGWLRGKLGGAGRGGAMGEAGINPAAMNVGRALGTAKFGASSGGLFGMLAGKLGTVALVALTAVAGGMYISNHAPAPAPSTGAFSSGKSDNYVPAIMRTANQGSSLDMFKDTNKNTGLAMEADPSKAAAAKAAADKAAADKAAAENPAAEGGDPNQAAPEQSNMASDMMGKLQGGGGGSLTSSLGGGGSKFSAMGGFGNKFNQGSVGAKTGLNTGIGSGFAGMPKFDSRKGKMLAMKGAARPVFSGAKGGKTASMGPKSRNQLDAMRNTQKSYTGSNTDSLRSTQDKAWEGSTAEGDASGGAGLGSGGGAGVMTSPSLDNSSTGGGGNGSGNPATPVVPPASGPTDTSPWGDLISECMQLVLLSSIMSAAAAYMCASKIPWVYVVGVILAAVAAIIAVMAIVKAIELMGKHGQALLGGLYCLGGVLAGVAAVMALTGSSKTGGMPSMVTALWIAAGGGWAASSFRAAVLPLPPGYIPGGFGRNLGNIFEVYIRLRRCFFGSGPGGLEAIWATNFWRNINANQYWPPCSLFSRAGPSMWVWRLCS